MIRASINFGSWSRASALVGGGVWLLLLLPLPVWFELPVESGGETWLIERLLLLAVLVCTPIILRLTATPARNGEHPLVYRVAVLLQPFAALLVVVSFYTRTGVIAAWLTLGWLLLTATIALFGLSRVRRRRSLWPVEELCLDAGLAYVVVGSGWLWLSRGGMNPLQFSDTIVLLTAVHFHYAGFAAPVLTGLAGRSLSRFRPALRQYFLVAAAGVIAGPPLVAAGITFSRTIEMLAAFVLAVSLFVLAMLSLLAIVPRLKRRVAQLLLILSANSVLVAMSFACLYALGRYQGVTTVTIPVMAQIHGVTNAGGFVLCGLLAWLVETSAAEAGD